ncbi:MAG: aldehyde dehydrogenase family protein [Planctomycetota bacterium]
MADKTRTTRNAADRIEIIKTYKMFIGGKFPRTESGRFYSPQPDGKSLGNICRASRKDVRNAVVAARGAFSGWAGRTAYNRGQILYRIGEMLEGRADQFVAELKVQGLTATQAVREVDLSIDRLIYYAGWCDKYQQIFSAVNPVSSSHFNFSVLEPTGVVGILASDESPVLGMISLIAPVIASGNVCVVLASETRPLSAITFAEVLQTSDVPGGVVNILTGHKTELSAHFAMHFDVNSIACDSLEPDMLKEMQTESASNVKRIKHYDCDWADDASASPYMIRDFCEVKTTWHPIEQINASGSGY